MPGAVVENTRPMLCGVVTEYKCNEHLESAAVLGVQWNGLSAISFSGAAMRDHVRPDIVVRDGQGDKFNDCRKTWCALERTIIEGDYTA